MTTTSVTASEFAKNFGRFQDEAQRQAVEITSHGRTVGYFISPIEFERYQQLRERDRKAYRIEDVPPNLMEQIRNSRMSPEHDHLNSLLDDDE